MKSDFPGPRNGFGKGVEGRDNVEHIGEEFSSQMYLGQSAGREGGVGGGRRAGCWVGNGKPGDSARGSILIRARRCVETNNPAQVGNWTEDQTPGSETI